MSRGTQWPLLVLLHIESEKKVFGRAWDGQGGGGAGLSGVGSTTAWKGEGLWAVRCWLRADHPRLLSEVGEMSALTPCFKGEPVA